MLRIAMALILLAVGAAGASDAPLIGSDGHPRDRLPLAVHVAAFGTPALDRAASRAVDD